MREENTEGFQAWEETTGTRTSPYLIFLNVINWDKSSDNLTLVN